MEQSLTDLMEQRRKEKEDLQKQMNLNDTSPSGVIKNSDIARRLAELEQKDAKEDYTSEINKLDLAAQTAKDMYNKDVDQQTWGQLADIVGRSLAKIGAAQAGREAGVDASQAVDTKSPIDWSEAKKESRMQYGDTLGDIGDKRKAQLGLLETTAKNSRDKLNDTMEALARASKIKQEAEYSKGSDQTGVWTDKGVPLFKDRSGGYILSTTLKPYNPLTDGDIIPAKDTDTLTGVGTNMTIGDIPLSKEESRTLKAMQTQFASETKEVRDQLDSIEIVNNLIKDAQENDNPSSWMAVGTAIAKLWQGGRLTDKDVELYIQRKDLKGKALNWIHEMALGTAPNASLEQLTATVKILAQATRRGLLNRAKEKGDILITSYPSRGFKSEAVAPLIYSGYVPPIPKQETQDTSNNSSKTVISDPVSARRKRIKELEAKLGQE